MKTPALFLFCLFCSLDIVASCSWAGLYAFPEGKNIRPNSIFVIEGYGQSQDIIKQLNEGYPVYLLSGTQRIKLKVQEILYGQFDLTQAVLKPEQSLVAGQQYQLTIDSMEGSLSRWNSETSKSEPITYMVLADQDTTKPIITVQPKFLEMEHIRYGCGPSIHVIFNCKVTDSIEYLVKASVRNKATGETVSYYIELKEGKIFLGHDMCSGAFVFEKNKKYEVQFSIMDASGNLKACEGPPIKFKLTP